MTLLPTVRGTAVARKVRLDTWAAAPLTATDACWSFTVPTTISFTMPDTEMEASVVTNWSGGEVIVTWGGVVSRVTWMLAVLAPADVVAVAAMMLGPSSRGTERLKLPLPTGAARPLTVTVAVGSLTVPLTVMGLRPR